MAGFDEILRNIQAEVRELVPYKKIYVVAGQLWQGILRAPAYANMVKFMFQK